MELIGSLIAKFRKVSEFFAKDRVWSLRACGLVITLIIILISGISGWLIERLALTNSPITKSIGSTILVISMASTLASKSLRTSVLNVLEAIPKNHHDDEDLQDAQKQLSKIVGRDVWQLKRAEIIRASAETASENSIDGVFAPLFWLFIGAALWNISPNLPGPLSLALVFKSSSTIDSMLGYRVGRLRWLGTAGAKLDDILTWIPCRAVLLTLPLISQPIYKFPALVKAAWVDGSKDISPNSGLSEAIFAHCAEVRMGGGNWYKGQLIQKPIIAKDAATADINSVEEILRLSFRLEVTWLVVIAAISYSI